MDTFISKNFLLKTAASQELYHQSAASLPIIDYHSHLSPRDIAEDRSFNNLTQIWLNGDHYKWRAMRTLGIDEQFITGNTSDFDRFKKWASIVPYTVRNPLYHWTHMELKNYFGINRLLNSDNAEVIFDETAVMLQSEEFSTRNLLRSANVEMICTTDDPVDNLEYHRQIQDDNFEIQVLPTFRPDKAYAFENPEAYNEYLTKLEEASNIEINTFDNLLSALEKRISFFDARGCKISDHGLKKIDFQLVSDIECEKWFGKLRNGQSLTNQQIKSLRCHTLLALGKMYAERGWIQQFHLGALRDTNERMEKVAGSDSGFDSIGDFNQARGLAPFLNELDKTDELPKTILYNLNPKDSAMMATMAGNFNDGSIRGKVQYGPGWWYLDQKSGIEEQLDILSNMGILSCFIGMLTDSRSFLSYSRHEYFRRILCNVFGNDIRKSEIPNDIEWIKSIIEDICYNNAKNYFELQVKQKVL